MSKKLKILEKSLENKNKKLDLKYENYFEDVKSANGQPLNDKRSGNATLSRWDRKSQSISNQRKEVEKTERAIEKEKNKIFEVDECNKIMPNYLQELIIKGTLIQWRRHPKIMFVKGVEKARIKYDEKRKLCSCSYLKSIPNQEQYTIFRDVFNEINKLQKIEK